MKNKALNMAFINGDISFEKNINDEYSLIPKPFLKALHIEMIEY